MNYPKRLIEVDLPIKKISAHARREKSIRHGHISTMHIWWARRPLAACRAVLCAALWPDPADPLCPQQFREDACRIINDFAGKAASNKTLAQRCSHEAWKKWQTLSKLGQGGLDSQKEAHWNVLRFALLDFIADFSDWENSTVPEYLEASRALTQSAHEGLGGARGTHPLVVDPFAGGGSIPLEALRIGADSFASDLNPVAVLLNKVVLEYIPKYGEQLADEVRKWGQWIKDHAEKDLRELYPADPNGSIPLAYFWARTVKCEGPGCGAEIPLIRSLWLAKRDHGSVALKIIGDREKKTVRFELLQNAAPRDIGPGTVKRSSATCPCCGYTTSAENVRAQFRGRFGGSADARLLAVILSNPIEKKRFYRLADESDRRVARLAEERLRLAVSAPNATGDFPQEPLPYLRSIFNINLLDVNRWSDLFSPRQLLTISKLTGLVVEASSAARSTLSPGLSEALATCLALIVGRQADYSTSLCSWHLTGEKINHTYGRQALGIIWDFAEVCPFASGSGNFEGAINWVATVCERGGQSRLKAGHAELASATDHPLPDDSASAFVTDPPYYDAVPYADLSDFFYVWLKRSLKAVHPSLFSTDLTPKEKEVVQLAERNPIYAYKTKENFELLMCRALTEGRRVTQPEGIGVVVFAHKTTSAWEVMLQAVVAAGWTIVASWPIDTEMGTRLRAMNSATLSSSVHLVCRPRETPDGSHGESDIGDWRDVLAELPKRIHDWMPRLQGEGVVGADAIFACLGPALEIFSRYSRVEKPNGDQVKLKEYLEYVWAAVSREAISMIFEGADTTGFEEDARLTAMWLWTLSSGPSNGEASEAGESEEIAEDSDETSAKAATLTGFTLEYDAARKIAQGLGAHLELLVNLVEVKGETARLLPVAERTKSLFGKEGTESPLAKRKKSAQLSLPGLLEELEREESGWTLQDAAKPGSTVSAGIKRPQFRRFVVKENQPSARMRYHSTAVSKSPNVKVASPRCDNRRYGRTALPLL